MAPACAVQSPASTLPHPATAKLTDNDDAVAHAIGKSAIFTDRHKLGSRKTSTRPAHRRLKSRRESSEPLAQIRRAFQMFLGRSRADLVSIANDFFCVAVGLSPAFVLPDYTLDMAQTNRLGCQLSHVLSTCNVVFLLDAPSSRLIVVDTNCLFERANNYKSDATFFMSPNAEHMDDIISPQDIDFMTTGCSRLVHLLEQSDAQVISCDEMQWDDAHRCSRMTTLSEWLQRFPVCYVSDEPDNSPPALPKTVVSWSLQAQLDASDPVNDHKLAACRVPASVFPFDSLTRESTHEHSGTGSSVASMQDTMQSYFFDRLNGSEMAAHVWDSVIVEANLCPWL